MILFSRCLAGLLGLLAFMPLSVLSQLDTLHYIPPIHEGYPVAVQGALYISTPSATPVNFTLTNGLGTVLATGNVSNANAFRYQMNGVNANALLPASDLNTVISNAGFIVRSSSPVYANLRYVGNSNNQSFSITSKGQRAFGTSFRIAHAKADAASPSRSVVSVMATENNTQVTIDLSGTNVILAGPTPPNTATPISFTLNQGQSYSIALYNSVNGVNRDNMIGRLISSNRPIVTVMGNYLGCFVSGNHDIGLDQPVAENLLGTSYAFLQGLGSNDKERVLIVANQNGTEVFINGNAAAAATLNAGDHLEIPGSNYNADSVMFVQTSQPVYAWQILFGTNSFANWGLNFVPPVSCLTERFVDFIPAIDSVGTRAFTGNLNIITYTGSTVLVNGLAPAIAPVNVPGSNLVAYRIHGLSGGYSISSSTIAVVGFYGANGPSSYAGYFSGFDSIPEIFVSLTDSICPDTLFVNGGFDSYQWLYNGSSVPTASDTFLPMGGITGAFNVVVSKGSCIDTSGTYTIACILPILLEHFSLDCSSSGKMDINWKTTIEENIEAFAVDGSRDGITWEKIGELADRGAGITYELQTTIAQPWNMIRLWAVDSDGRSTIVHSERVDCYKNEPILWFQPHPSAGIAHLHFRGTGKDMRIDVWDGKGQEITSRTFAPGIGEVENWNLELPTGIYLVQLTSEEYEIRRKIVVQ